MLRWWELLRPTPRLDEDEWEGVQTMSRARYAARLTGWERVESVIDRPPDVMAGLGNG